MTNLERWMFYMQEIPSPELFIEWGFYSMISSSLQRRVFIGDCERGALYPNMYVILVGHPATGKGRVTKEVANLLRLHKRDEQKKDLLFSSGKTNDNLDEDQLKKGEKPLLIPVGANASTYEALVRAMSRSCRSLWYKTDGVQKLYYHSSITFCLEELGSLFRKHTEDLVTFLLEAYDCGDYRYETISRNVDFIKHCCLNLLAGTTPGFMKRVFGDELLTEGFASRTVFVSGLEPRFFRAFPPVYTKEQLAEYGIIADHLKKIANLFGEVKVTPEAREFFQNWWQTDAQNKRVNKNPKLIPYYGRKNITVQKLAMAMHFADSTEMEIGIDKFIKAIDVLENTEKRMHFAVTSGDKNPLADVSKGVYNFLKVNGPQKKANMLVQFWDELPNGDKSLGEVITFLLASDRIRAIEGSKYEIKRNEEVDI